MKLRLAVCVAVGLLIAVVGCGSGDDPGVPVTGVLFVSRGGSDGLLFTQTQERLSFADSITVAVRGLNDDADQFTIYTFFGLTGLTFDQVPSAVLVTFVDGLDPTASATTALPSNQVGMVFHSGFDRTLTNGIGGQVQAQDAPVVYEQARNGALVLEPRPSGSEVFVGQTATDRRARYVAITITDLNSGAEVLVDGAVEFQLSVNPTQDFLSYVGNLGLLTQPPSTGGGPPAPPGTIGDGTGGGGGTGGGTDQPPAPPL